MKEPDIKRFPTEIFGHPYNDKSAEAKKCLDDQWCPFINDICKKPRKSQPHIKVGICSVGYRGEFLTSYKPVIVCPYRFFSDNVFLEIQKNYLNHWKGNIEWVSEVGMGVGGSIDRVAVLRDKKDGSIKDFLCVEFQAAGTTGTPWQAVLDIKKYGKFKNDKYPYGINWANEFLKTMMQQVYKKGRIVDSWRRKIVFVFQDIGLEYLKSAVDSTDLREANDSDPIHFCTFEMIWDNTKWNLVLKERLSTSLEGINKILGGAGSEHYPTVEEFTRNVNRKGLADDVFS